jgi:hypothetical protein
VWDIVENGYVEPENVTLLTMQQLKLLKERKVADKKTDNTPNTTR